MFNPIAKQVKINIDVIVDEMKDWSSEKKKNPDLILEQDSSSNEAIIENESEVRRSSRTRIPPARLQDYDLLSDSQIGESGYLVHLALFVETKPITMNEALKSVKWKDAMCEELKSIEKNNTWELLSLPPNKKTIDVKWVFKVKEGKNSEVLKHKARLMVNQLH
jgi:hypothetical protein